MGRPLLITGGRGFIGKALISELERANINYVNARHVIPGCDLRDDGVFEKILSYVNPVAIAHFAWPTNTISSYQSLKENYVWAAVTRDIAHQSADAKIPCFIAGSAAEIERDNHSQYAEAKRWAFTECLDLIKSKRLTWLRIFYAFDVMYGHHSLELEIQRSKREKRPVRLTNPEQLHDFIHVADVGVAIALAYLFELKGLIEVGSARLHSVLDLAQAAGCEYVPLKKCRPNKKAIQANNRELLRVGWTPSETTKFFRSIDPTD